MPQNSINLSENKPDSCLLGAHFSIAKGLHNALYTAKSLGCTALQIFTKNASTWKEKTLSQKDIKLFKQAIKETGIKAIASHSSYLINLAANDTAKHARSIDALKHELVRSSLLSIPYVVFHPGSHMGSGEKEGTCRISQSINQIFNDTPGAKTRLLLETTAGQGSSIGHTFEQLASIIDGVKDKNRIGVCLDTCHIFAAGYDIRTKAAFQKTFKDFETITGMGNLYLIHLNDSKKMLGSRVDRHEHIGQGFIGIKAFSFFMNDKRFSGIPKIIETPKGKPDDNPNDNWDKVNLEQLRSLL